MDRTTLREKAIAFLQENQLEGALKDLCDSDEIQTAAKEAYEDLKNRTEVFLSKAPEEIGEQVAEARQALNDYSFDDFMEDLRDNMGIHICKCLAPAMELCKGKDPQNTICEIGRKAIAVDNDYMKNAANEILDRLANSLFESIIQRAFAGYMPKGIPAEVAGFIRGIAGGGVVIPGESFMAFLNEMSEEDKEEE